MRGGCWVAPSARSLAFRRCAVLSLDLWTPVLRMQAHLLYCDGCRRRRVAHAHCCMPLLTACSPRVLAQAPLQSSHAQQRPRASPPLPALRRTHQSQRGLRENSENTAPVRQRWRS